ncbi:MAG TPA: hypothetical protein VFE41_27180 [Acetobacteraceae bacterium]|jgi:hypothetical protein|nr:hypothetical protein [Acetobacteraceae bacterium]HTC12461.1 hypothetical protein [Acetobacteraceae bacterium]
MRRSVLAVVATVSLGGLVAANLFAHAGAQPAPPPMAGNPPPDGGWRTGPRHAGPGWGPGWHRHAMERMRTFALLYRPDDRHLTPADVQKIAEAFLLWNGNHTWKVTNVAAGKDNAISFTIAAPDGTVIAIFDMDGKTGRVTRTG